MAAPALPPNVFCGIILFNRRQLSVLIQFNIGVDIVTTLCKKNYKNVPLCGIFSVSDDTIRKVFNINCHFNLFPKMLLTRPFRKTNWSWNLSNKQSSIKTSNHIHETSHRVPWGQLFFPPVHCKICGDLCTFSHGLTSWWWALPQAVLQLPVRSAGLRPRLPRTRRPRPSTLETLRAQGRVQHRGSRTGVQDYLVNGHINISGSVSRGAPGQELQAAQLSRGLARPSLDTEADKCRLRRIFCGRTSYSYHKSNLLTSYLCSI